MVCPVIGGDEEDRPAQRAGTHTDLPNVHRKFGILLCKTVLFDPLNIYKKNRTYQKNGMPCYWWRRRGSPGATRRHARGLANRSLKGWHFASQNRPFRSSSYINKNSRSYPKGYDLLLVETKRIELSTLRMRTVRSPS